jgi:hypothetical protein
MDAMAKKIRFSSLFVFSLCVACGGEQSTPETPADSEPTEEGAAVEEAEPASTGKPDDGIVRDTDGDGVPDDKQAGDCEKKNETQCKINDKCAWTDKGTCVPASDAKM